MKFERSFFNKAISLFAFLLFFFTFTAVITQAATTGVPSESSINLNITAGKTYYVNLTPANVQSFGGQTYTLTYDPAALTLLDFAAQTPAADVNPGPITGTGITIISNSGGVVQFTVGKTIPSGSSWFGTLTIMKFTAKTTGNTTVKLQYVDTNMPVIVIDAQPAAGTTVTQGSVSGSLTVGASVSPSVALSYQWYSSTTDKNSGGTAISDATGATFAIPANLTADNSPYYYYCVVSADGAESVTSAVITVTVLPQ